MNHLSNKVCPSHASLFRSGLPARVGRVLTSTAVLFAFGCGGGSSDFDSSVLVPVSGKVLIDGQPVPGVSITLHPKGTTPGTGGFAVSDADGNFTVDHRSGSQGVEPGEYAVTFSRYTQPDGSPIPPDASAADVGATESLPRKYTDPTDPQLPTHVQVTATGGEFPFEIVTTKSLRKK